MSAAAEDGDVDSGVTGGACRSPRRATPVEMLMRAPRGAGIKCDCQHWSRPKI